jgi:hypothetical protein
VFAPDVITHDESKGEAVATVHENEPELQVVAVSEFPEDPQTGLLIGAAILQDVFELTVTGVMQEEVLLHWSVADIVTIVFPIGKGAENGSESLLLKSGVSTPSQLSLAEGLKVTVLLPLSQKTILVDDAPQLMKGAVVSSR